MGRVRTESNRQLERLFRMGTVGGLTDGQLLERFVAGDDEEAESAFEAIVERHGPMVLRVCRTVLRDAHAAEDAFQATFLVLARKAKTLGERELLGNWLYGVATRTARKAKVAAARRLGRDREAACLHAVAIDDRPPDEIRDELGRILHEEIDRLPGSYRAAVVTCYLEGMTQEQAARQLRLAESTVRGRLARARKLLGSRLTRRGVSLFDRPAGARPCRPGASTASRLPDSIVRSVARSALLFGKSGKATGGAVSSTARAIASGVLSTMWLPSLKTVAAAMVALTFTAVAMTHRAAEAQPQVQSPPPTVATPEPEEAAESSPEPVVDPTDPLPQDPDSGQVKARTRKGEGRSQSVAVDSELADVAPGPIVRAVPISKDSMILAYLPDQNVGHVDNLGLANNGGGVRALFDWPAIPPDDAAADDRRFLIAVYSRRTTSRPSAGPIEAHEILEDWPEIAHWSEMPRYDREVAATYNFEPGDGWKLFDITPLVRARAKAGRKGHGVLLRFQGEDHDGASWSGYDLVSREGAGEWMKRRPVLLAVDASKSGQTKRVAEARPETRNSRKPSVAPAIDSELVKAAPGTIVRTVPVSKDCMVLAYMPGWNFGNVQQHRIPERGWRESDLARLARHRSGRSRLTRPTVSDRALLRARRRHTLPPDPSTPSRSSVTGPNEPRGRPSRSMPRSRSRPTSSSRRTAGSSSTSRP